MTTITLVCPNCSKSFDKEQKEITRQKKRGKTQFFCSLKCSGSFYGTEHLQADSVKKKAQAARSQVARKIPCPFRECIRRAKFRGKLEDITIESLRTVWENKKGKCAVTGVDLKFDSKNPNYLASLDRIDSTKGYGIGNVQFISLTANHAKNKYGQNILDEFVQIIRSTNSGH